MMYELFDEETMRKQLDTARSRRDLEKGRAEGRAEGRTEGKAEEKISIALNMLAKGKLSVEEVAEYSDLALEKVKELASHTPSTAHA